MAPVEIRFLRKSKTSLEAGEQTAGNNLPRKGFGTSACRLPRAMLMALVVSLPLCAAAGAENLIPNGHFNDPQNTAWRLGGKNQSKGEVLDKAGRDGSRCVKLMPSVLAISRLLTPRTKPMWDTLRDQFVEETHSAGRRAIARAVVALARACPGRLWKSGSVLLIQ